MAYETKTVTVDGIKIVVPTQIPSNERAETLRALYRQHVRPVDATKPRGATLAFVPASLADDVAEAMEFMGDLIACRAPGKHGVFLGSDGYYANGF